MKFLGVPEEQIVLEFTLRISGETQQELNKGFIACPIVIWII